MAQSLLGNLSPVNPIVAVRCLLEGGAQASERVRQIITRTLIATLADEQLPPIARAQTGRLLARLGDPRPGVGVRADGLPDIAWCDVPAGPFLMGSTDDDEMAERNEKPQHRNKSITVAYRIGRYPVTNAQFTPFVAAGGYQERRYWTEAGWKRKEGEPWTGQARYGDPFDLPNHPVVGVSWYEALAFCRWLTEQLRQKGELGADEEITLPTESQWEKAARGTNGRRYPWGDDPNPNQAGYHDTWILTTSAVGCFPGGASPYEAQDLSGNVWEWCRIEWEEDYTDYRGDDDLGGSDRRVLRGGSFYDPARLVRCACRVGNFPDFRYEGYGFRVVASLSTPYSGNSEL
jgi:formylglycine-generating enzyme required for sulfatase activity